MNITKCGAFMIVLISPAGTGWAQTATAQVDRAAVPAEPVPLATLAKSIVVRYEMFTLPNGLRVVVHPDRSVKTVSVMVDYAVGSASEPAGKTGFAHLFEHLMFNGSENSPEDHSVPMQKLGATINGVTQFDRTAYYNVVPTPGLEQTLFLESDRMGYLLGAINQSELDEQRGVVQNEKRLAEAAPLSTMRSRIQARLFSAAHPYGHDLNGSMADLNKADLDDVRAWFRTHYGPNNAVLTLTGDIDGATARRLVTKYFGAIPAGPNSERPTAPVPTLPQRLDETVTDRISEPYLYRAWAVPGITAPDAVALRVAAGVMTARGGTALSDRLVKRDKMFSSLFVALEQFDAGGIFNIHGSVAPGVDAKAAGHALDAAIAEAARARPATATIERYLTGELTLAIREAAASGGVGQVVNGLRLGRGAEWYREQLGALVAQTPDSVSAAATRWLGRPTYALTVMPGEAPSAEIAAPRGKAPVAAAAVSGIKGDRGPLPPEGSFTELVFPTAERTRLSNGIELVYLRNGGAPLTEIQVDFDAGSVADPVTARGTQAMVLALLDKGTTSHDAAAIDELRERMGAETTLESDADRTTAGLTVPTANLQPAADLLADMLRHPAFAPAEVDAARASAMAEAAADMVDGGSLLDKLLRERIDAGSPYTRRTGPRSARAIAAVSATDLRAFSNAWLRPEKATIFIVSDAPLNQVRAALERSLGDWRGTGTAGSKDHALPTKAAGPGIVLVDRPGSDQAVIVGGQAVAKLSPDVLLAAKVANGALAGDGMGRVSNDLRETKGWSYNVVSQFTTRALGGDYLMMAPVQQDKAGASIVLVRDHLAAFVGGSPLTKAEFDGTIRTRIRSMFVTFSGARSFMDAIRNNRQLGLPDDTDAGLAARYRTMTLEQARVAFRTAVDPATFVWVVGGDAAKLKPQLAPLGLPITVVGAAPKAQ